VNKKRENREVKWRDEDGKAKEKDGVERNKLVHIIFLKAHFSLT